MGSEEDFAQMIKFMQEKQIKPVIDTVFPWAEAEKALRRMDNREQFGKIVLQVE
jgi:NADPH:quinone reductase-like Zn-dependent oxidoreductase